MTHIGFGQRWRNWVFTLWCTSSSTMLLNGEHGKRILQCRGLWQGDPLSSMLFLLAMEHSHMLFRKARETSLLRPISPRCDTFRVLMYVYDTALFVNPTKHDLETTDYILQTFFEANGLIINMFKTQYLPIQCHDIDLEFLAFAGRSTSTFPCT
jgi:hypothetical protein